MWRKEGKLESQSQSCKVEEEEDSTLSQSTVTVHCTVLYCTVLSVLSSVVVS